MFQSDQNGSCNTLSACGLKLSLRTLTTLLAVAYSSIGLAQDGPNHARPLLRDFLGLNVHTVQFKPELYKPVARLLRDYHGFNWDVGEQTDYEPTFPTARNGVNWQELYGEWKNQGYAVDVCVQFDAILPQAWADFPQDAYAYGYEFAKYFGPSGSQKLAEAIEIGNEPGDYSDADYRALLERAASGIRKADAKLLIASCAVFAKPSGKYHKSVETLKGLESLYDVLSVHSYPMLEGYPTWRRSYPEDSRLTFLTDITDVIAWRDKYAPGKQIWLTEFGYDATTKPQHREGTFSKWEGVTDEQQAQYLVRSILVLAELPLNRAYIYWFNDNDEPQLHGASGLTRNYVPKPAFHAVAHLYDALGGYRFGRIVAKQPDKLYVYEFVHPSGDRIWVAWSPTGEGRTENVKLAVPAARIKRAERTPIKAGPAEVANWVPAEGDQTSLEVNETPLYLWIVAE